MRPHISTSYFVIHLLNIYTDLKVYHSTFHPILGDLHVEFCKGGTIACMSLDVKSASVTAYKTFPWSQLDQNLGSRIEDLSVLYVYSEDAAPWEVRNLSKVLSREMINLVKAGKLYVGQDYDKGRSWRVGQPMEGEDEQYEDGSEQYGDESDEEEHQDTRGTGVGAAAAAAVSRGGMGER